MTDDAEYPEILADLAEQVAASLVKRGIANQTAVEAGRETAEFFRRHWGGQKIYISKGHFYELSQRDTEICKKFNGKNFQELCREFNLTEQQIRHITNTGRQLEAQRRQTKLF